MTRLDLLRGSVVYVYEHKAYDQRALNRTQHEGLATYRPYDTYLVCTKYEYV